MMPRFCPVCGKELSDKAAVCPCCNHTLPPRAVTEPVDLAKEKELLLGFLATAYADPDELGKAYHSINAHLEKYRTILSKYAHRYLSEVLESAYEDAAFGWESHKSAQEKKAKEALRELNVLSNRKSSYKGLGFSAITDTAGAAAYAALDAAQGHVHDVTQARVNAKLSLEAAEKLSDDSDISRYAAKIAQALQEIFYHIGFMLESRVFVEEHRDFYAKPTGMEKKFGINLHQAVCSAAHGNDFVYWFAAGQDPEPYTILEAAGYIKLCRSYGKYDHTYYYSTGKYETEALRESYRKEHPREAAADKAAVEAANQYHCTQAEEALRNKQYYRAATRFAQAEGDPQAMRRSLQIWEQHLMNVPQQGGSGMLAVDGTYYDLFGKSADAIPTSHKFCQLFAFGAHHEQKYIGLTMEGAIVASRQNICDGRLNVKHELEKPCIPGNGSNWTDVKEIACTYDRLVALHNDGRVSAVGVNGNGVCDSAEWRDIVRIQALPGATVGFRADGSFLYTGDQAAECRRWTNVKDFCFHEGAVLALTHDGRVLMTKFSETKYPDAAKWRNVVRLRSFYGCLMGITDTGNVLCSTRSKYLETLCGHLKGIVNISCCMDETRCSALPHYRIVALKADGTVLDTGWGQALSGLCNTVAVYLDRAVTADGHIVSSRQAIPGERIFSNVDTYAEERRTACEKARANGQAARRETVQAEAQALKKKKKRNLLMIPAVLVNIVVTAVLVLLTVFLRQDDEIQQATVTASTIAAILSLPGLGHLIFRDKNGCLLRILRWILVIGILAVGFYFSVIHW